MKVERGFFVHLALLVVAAAFAVGVWTRDKKAAAQSQADVTVWQGRADDVERIAYEGKKKKVVLEAKKDKVGRYFIGSSEREAAAPEGEKPAEDEPQGKQVTFVSVGGAEKLAEMLAPLKALRGIGRIGDDRAAEFGLDAPEGTLTVTIKGAERRLTFGAATPGGADRYARDPGSGEVYAVKGDIFRDLDQADSRLLERDLHEWRDVDVTAAKVTAGDRSRELRRSSGGDGKKFWADPGSEGQADETAGNWMTKLDRLRPTEYLPAAPEGREVVVRVDYMGAGGALGFVELVKVPGTAGGKAEYSLLTERLRLNGKVPATLAEQVEQDLGAVVK
ncbi:DUF4340 domain-containing protein [Chondromyces apiculatus]|uniref:DUF4340 domain-containing protein n=1 Tax=Chondromyces apiculatus DSM 436 TaxID=1192034 RepID=A0A017T9J3_9BACT|nr:DUF4340 domain-containing protein [Chondromyces apiculatus]EYF05291.1 Hypothetical protein CAP_3432 [Chondromyces apiculatus DSM 436]